MHGKSVDSKEVFSFDKLLPAIAFHSFNVLRSPFGNAIQSNEKLDMVDSMMPLYTEDKENKELDCDVHLENKAISLMLISNYMEEMKKRLVADEDELDAGVEIELAPMVIAFKDAMEKKYIKKLTPIEANKRGIKTGIKS